jgi:hypothetical protein
MQCATCYKSPVLTILVLMLLIVVGSAATVGGAMYVNEKRKRLGGGSSPKALPGAPGDRMIERTIRELRVGDVLTLDARDFLVEGTIAYDEDGHRWTGARIADGGDVRWLVVGIERVGASAVRLLAHDEENEVTGYPPETIVIGETRYALDKRGTATCKLSGDVGHLTGVKDKRPEGHVERCRWWLYGGAGDDTLVLEQWGSDYRMLRGKKVSPDTIDLIPGS